MGCIFKTSTAGYIEYTRWQNLFAFSFVCQIDAANRRAIEIASPSNGEKGRLTHSELHIYVSGKRAMKLNKKW